MRYLLTGSALLVLVLVFAYTNTIFAQGVGSSTVIIEGRVPGCGDGIIDSGEECDSGNFGGASCQSRGFTSGVLACTSSCLFNTLSCVYTPPSGGGGGGGGSQTRGAQVVITGRAYPGSEVTILKDAQVVATTIADENATFQVLVRGLAAGTYIFSLYSEDTKGIRSSLLTFPVTVTRNILAKIESVYVAPTITGDKIEVKKGNPIILFGQSFPLSAVTLEVNSEQQFFVKTTAGTDGVYLRSFDSSVLEVGEHHAKARSSIEDTISSQSAAYAFSVGTKDVYREASVECSPRADLNADCRVNLVDFSIAAFWYLRSMTPEFALREAKHLNGDGKINLVDFSILAFNWTG
ncbi:MAG: hypothetical protein RLZZ360_321 [Candidatus Parcubacteria bacterium]|jgi:hypothetical protein